MCGSHEAAKILAEKQKDLVSAHAISNYIYFFHFVGKTEPV